MPTNAALSLWIAQTLRCKCSSGSFARLAWQEYINQTIEVVTRFQALVAHVPDRG